MSGLGCDIDGKVVGFTDLSSEVWSRVNRAVNGLIAGVDEVGDNVRMTWLDVFAWPMRDPAAARLIHEECVRVAIPGCDPAAKSRELAPDMKTLNVAFVAVPDDVPAMEDGRPTQGADSTTSG